MSYWGSSIPLMINDIKSSRVFSCRTYSAINRERESFVKSQWVSRSVPLLSARICTFSLSLSLFLSALCACLCVRTLCTLTRRFNMASRALVPRYPYAANGNGRISFCAVVCIDSAVHSPLYAGCVLAYFFHYSPLRISRNTRRFGMRYLPVAYEMSHFRRLNFVKGFSCTKVHYLFCRSACVFLRKDFLNSFLRKMSRNTI